MPQLQLPIFPAGSKCITSEIAVECQGRQVVYVYGSLPVFQHEKGDPRSFRLFTSQLIDMGAARQVDIVKAFGVPLPTVKRYLKVLRDRGPQAFYAQPRRRSGCVLSGEALQERGVLAAGRQQRAGGGAGYRDRGQHAPQSDSRWTTARR